jgi:hypothetical protein
MVKMADVPSVTLTNRAAAACSMSIMTITVPVAQGVTNLAPNASVDFYVTIAMLGLGLSKTTQRFYRKRFNT